MYTVSSGNCPSFSCATSSSLHMLTAGPRDQFPRCRRSRKKSFCVLRFEVSRSVITVQRDFCARCATRSSKLCTKLTLHCNHRSGHLKTEHTESLFLLRRHLKNWPRGPALSMRSKLLVAHEKLGQLSLLTVHVLPV
jgi:hypothetical protein